MKKSAVAVAVALAWALAACGTRTATAETGVAETSTTVPADRTSYEAQEWATFRLADLPVRYRDLEDSMLRAYFSQVQFARSYYAPITPKSYRLEVSSAIHDMDAYMESLRPALDILDAASAAGTRDNDLAALAPELVLFHRGLVERLANLHELHNSTLAMDGDRFEAVREKLSVDPFPVSFVCAYHSMASAAKWTQRLDAATNANIARIPALFGCNGETTDPDSGA